MLASVGGRDGLIDAHPLGFFAVGGVANPELGVPERCFGCGARCSEGFVELPDQEGRGELGDGPCGADDGLGAGLDEGGGDAEQFVWGSIPGKPGVAGRQEDELGVTLR